MTFSSRILAHKLTHLPQQIRYTSSSGYCLVPEPLVLPSIAVVVPYSGHGFGGVDHSAFLDPMSSFSANAH